MNRDTREQTIVFGEGHSLIIGSALRFCALFWRFKAPHKAGTLVLTCSLCRRIRLVLEDPPLVEMLALSRLLRYSGRSRSTCNDALVIRLPTDIHHQAISIFRRRKK